VLVANDSDQPVWFDGAASRNVSISVQPALITQETHYDPWGLELAGIERRGSPEHRWKFQGKESITDLSLYWQDFGARYYDPQLGRWHTPDPADQFGSPYLAMGNNPVMLVDPDGRLVPALPLLAAFAIISGGINVATNWSKIGSLSQGLNYFGVGAISGAVGAVTGGPAGIFAAGALMGFGNAGIEGAGLFGMVTSGFTAGVMSAVTAGVFQEGGQAISNLVARRTAAKALEEAKKLTSGLKELTPRGVTPIEEKAANLASREMQEVALENAAGISQAARDPLNAAGQKLTHFELAQGGNQIPAQAAAKEGTATLYRNFGWNELSSLKNAGGKFSIHPNQFQGKQFWVGESGMNMWTNSSFAKPFTAKIIVPKSCVTPGHRNYIFMEPGMMIDGFPGGTVLPSNLQRFNSNMRIEWIRY